MPHPQPPLRPNQQPPPLSTAPQVAQASNISVIRAFATGVTPELPLQISPGGRTGMPRVGGWVGVRERVAVRLGGMMAAQL